MELFQRPHERQVRLTQRSHDGSKILSGDAATSILIEERESLFELSALRKHSTRTSVRPDGLMTIPKQTLLLYAEHDL